MVEHPFAFLQADLEWLERALTAVIDDYDAMASDAGWGKFYAKETLVRSAERSVRRSMKVYHCVFGPNQSCVERMVTNCMACAGQANSAAVGKKEQVA